jgi:hypothetical protein
MRIVDTLSQWLAPPELTRGRMWFAFAVAACTDLVQLSLGPLGWLAVDQLLDVVAMVLVSRAIGFHMLLLPTFVVELLPVSDMLPTWTGCTAAVIMLRRKSPPSSPPLPAKMAKVTPEPPVPTSVPPPPAGVPPRFP